MIAMPEKPTSRPVPEAAVSVPFSDLKAQFARLRGEVLEALEQVAESASYVLGPRVAEFEEQFASYIGVKHCVALNSGTSAVHLAVLCAGVQPGDEVLTVPMTFVATSWGISYAGATPVYVDIDPETYTMDVAQVERRLTAKTKALLPVHLYGQTADMEPLMDISRRHGIPLVEDACQAHGARYRGRMAGSFGICSAFSFYPGKNLGAYGEGGALCTDDDALANRARALRDQGQRQRYHHDELGFNYRMEAFQGAVLAIKLRHLENWTETREFLAERYLKYLTGLPLVLPRQAPDRRHVWHLFVALHPERDRIRDELQARGVQTGLHYPVPVHLQQAYRHLGYRSGDFPLAERVARECFTLPVFPEMTIQQQDWVIQSLTDILGKGNGS
jgi:dTDP-4-amino-4,6-dideoxygalactose transaminase